MANVSTVRKYSWRRAYHEGVKRAASQAFQFNQGTNNSGDAEISVTHEIEFPIAINNNDKPIAGEALYIDNVSTIGVIIGTQLAKPPFTPYIRAMMSNYEGNKSYYPMHTECTIDQGYFIGLGLKAKNKSCYAIYYVTDLRKLDMDTESDGTTYCPGVATLTLVASAQEEVFKNFNMTKIPEAQFGSDITNGVLNMINALGYKFRHPFDPIGIYVEYLKRVQCKDIETKIDRIKELALDTTLQNMTIPTVVNNTAAGLHYATTLAYNAMQDNDKISPDDVYCIISSDIDSSNGNSLLKFHVIRHQMISNVLNDVDSKQSLNFMTLIIPRLYGSATFGNLKVVVPLPSEKFQVSNVPPSSAILSNHSSLDITKFSSLANFQSNGYRSLDNSEPSIKPYPGLGVVPNELAI